jgi:hypothetical protein
VTAVDRAVAVHLLSFGYAHGPAPDAHIVLDLRAHFGDSPEADGLPELVEGVIPVLAAYRSGCGSYDGPVVVGVGCGDGRLAEAVAAMMQRRLDNGLVLVTAQHVGTVERARRAGETPRRPPQSS